MFIWFRSITDVVVVSVASEHMGENRMFSVIATSKYFASRRLGNISQKIRLRAFGEVKRRWLQGIRLFDATAFFQCGDCKRVRIVHIDCC